MASYRISQVIRIMCAVGIIALIASGCLVGAPPLPSRGWPGVNYFEILGDYVGSWKEGPNLDAERHRLTGTLSLTRSTVELGLVWYLPKSGYRRDALVGQVPGSGPLVLSSASSHCSLIAGYSGATVTPMLSGDCTSTVLGEGAPVDVHLVLAREQAR